MRSHSHLGTGFRSSPRWNFAHGTRGEVTNVLKNPPGSGAEWSAFSHSGKERNRTFLNLGSGRFADASWVSGADSIADGRSFVHWDFNRDGKPDLAVVNANRPLLQIFANRCGAGGGKFIAIRLSGGSRSAAPTPGLSNRDAIGAMVELDTGGGRLLRGLSAGEGFASQNSKTLVIGIGESRTVRSILVVWPSGRRTQTGPIDAGTLVHIDEEMGVVSKIAYSSEPPPSG